MTREASESKVWQFAVGVLSLTILMIGWYMNRLADEVDKANEGITTVSVQIARLESQVNGIEKRLDQRIAVEPLAFSNTVAVNSPLNPFAERSKDESR